MYQPPQQTDPSSSPYQQSWPQYPQSQYPPQQQWQPPQQPWPQQPPPPYQQQVPYQQPTQPPPYPAWQQPMLPYPPPMYYPPQVTQINIQQQQGPGCLVRGLWYVFVGSWLGFLWLHLGYAFCLTIVGLPLGLTMLNRLPWVLTLRPASQQVTVTVAPGITSITIGGSQQYSMLVRTLYFLCVGWWAGYLWALTGYILCTFIFTLPVGLMMLDRLPMVLTLRKN